VTTPPRPTLDETLARIDAVLTEPEPAPRPLSQLLQPPDAVSVADLTGDKLMEIAERHVLATSSEPAPTPMYPHLLARAIGWFRR
jgi:hypothetical protein